MKKKYTKSLQRKRSKSTRRVRKVISKSRCGERQDLNI